MQKAIFMARSFFLCTCCCRSRTWGERTWGERTWGECLELGANALSCRLKLTAMPEYKVAVARSGAI